MTERQETRDDYPPAPMMGTALRFWQDEAARLRGALEEIAAGLYPVPLNEDADAWRGLAARRKDIAQKALDHS
jgi:hypothetical protein